MTCFYCTCLKETPNLVSKHKFASTNKAVNKSFSLQADLYLLIHTIRVKSESCYKLHMMSLHLKILRHNNKSFRKLIARLVQKIVNSTKQQCIDTTCDDRARTCGIKDLLSTMIWMNILFCLLNLLCPRASLKKKFHLIQLKSY